MPGRSPVTILTVWRKSFSNFSTNPITIDGIVYRTVEHWFQWAKHTDPEQKETIRCAKTAWVAKRLGSSRKHPIRPDWLQVRDQVMLRGLRVKFRDSELQELLLSTGSAVIREPGKDPYWAKRLGELLMLVRAELRPGGRQGS